MSKSIVDDEYISELVWNLSSGLTITVHTDLFQCTLCRDEGCQKVYEGVKIINNLFPLLIPFVHMQMSITKGCKG